MISISYTFKQNLSIPITKACELIRFEHENETALADDFQNTAQLSVILS